MASNPELWSPKVFISDEIMNTMNLGYTVTKSRPTLPLVNVTAGP
jgi:hypothetical protein